MLNHSGSTPDPTYLGEVEGQQLRIETAALNTHFITPQQGNKLIPRPSQMPATRRLAQRDASQPPMIDSLIDFFGRGHQ